MWPAAKFSILRRLPLIPLAPALFLASSCQSTLPPLTPAELAQALPDDDKTLDNIASHNAGLQREFLSLKSTGDWQKRGYFSAEESDRIELLYFPPAPPRPSRPSRHGPARTASRWSKRTSW